MGPEDFKRNSGTGINTTFSLGDAIQVTTTDSWDDSIPSGCIQSRPVLHGSPIPECADGFGTWNQVRPGVFDGGYAFGGAAGDAELPAGKYIVESVMPAHYGIVKEEDKNVAFGEPVDAEPAGAAAALHGHARQRPAAAHCARASTRCSRASRSRFRRRER